MKGENQEVVWCEIDGKYNWREGEQDMFKRHKKAASVSPDVDAAWEKL